MELREIEKWDVIEEYSKDFSYFFSLVSRGYSILLTSKSFRFSIGLDRAWKIESGREGERTRGRVIRKWEKSFVSCTKRNMNERCSKTKQADSFVYQSFEIFLSAIVKLKTRRVTRLYYIRCFIRYDTIEKEFFYYAMVKQGDVEYERFRQINGEWVLITGDTVWMEHVMNRRLTPMRGFSKKAHPHDYYSDTDVLFYICGNCIVYNRIP